VNVVTGTRVKPKAILPVVIDGVVFEEVAGASSLKIEVDAVPAVAIGGVLLE
jgi:hypothetical protein